MSAANLHVDRRLPEADVVIVGLGFAGGIIAAELTKAGVDVVALERGPEQATTGNQDAEAEHRGSRSFGHG